MTTYALIGAAGYIAPRHMQAIRETGGELVAALDPHDSVGILDRYAPGCAYFREPERFDRHLSRHPVDYVVICSPNYLHDAHCRLALRTGADAICEKPLVLHERNLDELSRVEEQTGKRVWTVLQCRLHPEAVAAKEGIQDDRWYSVEVNYQTPRGPWYSYSWKGDEAKSGGVTENIGIHLFDLVSWLFGPASAISQAHAWPHLAYGRFNTDRATVHWRLSINGGDRSRVFDIDGEPLDLTKGFEDLHTEVHRRILAGQGCGIEDIRPATRIVEAIRNANH